MRVLLTILLSLLFLPCQGFADFSARVIGVIDGDSIKVLKEGKEEKVRLVGIDCPEKRQPFGRHAKEFTAAQSFGKEVLVQDSGRDRYGRTLAEVILPDGRSLNKELLKAGLAWWFRKYSNDLSLKELESEARMSKRGLWAEVNPIPPWEFRKAESKISKAKDNKFYRKTS